MIPRNLGPAKKLGCRVLPQGMCCVMMQEESASLDVATTFDAAASVNLEYLSIALQVRRSEAREPFFSLDPVNPMERNSMQFKRFEPAWLAGTSVGDILFQADYHLKELSMGEHQQPVVGMKSCFDLAEQEGKRKELEKKREQDEKEREKEMRRNEA